MNRDGWRLFLALLAAITLLVLIGDARPGSSRRLSARPSVGAWVLPTYGDPSVKD